MIPTLQLGQLGRSVLSAVGDASAGYLSPFYPTTLYSLRLRKSGYAGACIRVKRSSDSAQQDIGFGSDGWLDVSALTSFVGGSANGYVKTWYDQSGGGVDLTDSGASDAVLIVITGALQTLNGKPALKFSATPSRLQVAANAAFAFGIAAWTWETFLYSIRRDRHHRDLARHPAFFAVTCADGCGFRRYYVHAGKMAQRPLDRK